MKNAKWILGLVFALSLPASATTVPVSILNSLNSQGLDRKIHLLSSTDPGSKKPTPIRLAKMKIKVAKTTITKGPNGDFSFDETPVCTAEISVNVYDVRNHDPLTIDETDFNRGTCASTYLGQPVTLKIGGMLAFMNLELFERPEDIKTGYASLWADGASAIPVGAFLLSRDLNAHSLVALMQPSNLIKCDGSGSTSCDAVTQEFFSAVVDLQD